MKYKLCRDYYAGNKLYLFYKKSYTELFYNSRTSSFVGKFGGGTDNWMWPRHTVTRSPMFRIYADANGDPQNM